MMQALWLENQHLSYRDDVPIPEPGEDEALIRVRLAGICATDLELVKGYYPYTGILGHEFVGEIIKASSRVGERVVGEINLGCGQCLLCQRGGAKHCFQRRVLGIINWPGAFAEYVCLPLKNLWTVAAHVPDEAAVFTEPLAAALAIQEQVSLHPSHQVLIVGAGRLGQLIAQVLRLTGCALQVVTRYEQQRQLFTSQRIPWIDESKVPSKFFDVVIEATGRATGLTSACQAVRPGGTIILKSTYQGDFHLNLSSLVVDEIHLVGSRCGPFSPALRLLENQLVDPTYLIKQQFPLWEGLTAVKQAQIPGAFKILLNPQSSS